MKKLLTAITLFCLFGQNRALNLTSHNINSSHHPIAVAQEETPGITLPPSLEGLPARDSQAPWQGTDGELVLRSVGDVLIHDRVSWLADIDSPVYQASLANLQKEGLITQDGDVLGAKASILTWILTNLTFYPC